MKKVVYLLASILVYHTFFLNAQTSCPNLVTNGDFEAGNTGFTSGLQLGCSCNAVTYCVTTDFKLKCSSWPNFADHTLTGVGNFLTVDGSTTAATNVWQTTVAAVAGAPYTFSFWYASVYNSTSQSFDLGMMVNGSLVNTITVSQIAPNVPRWVQYTFSGICPVNNPVIAIRQLTAGAFRDFGLDDIVFRAPHITGNTSICSGASTILTASGGINYQWNTGASSAAISVSTGGTYTVTITDMQGCSTSISKTVVVSPPIIVTGAITPVKCFGLSTGSISTTTTGGTPPYQYLWNTNATTSAITNRPAGTYSVTVTDAANCTKITSFTITQPPTALTVNTTPTQITMVGGANGKIGFAISGGAPPYTTVLTLNGVTIAPTQTVSPQYNGLIKGTYQYTVTDANSCVSTGNVVLTGPTSCGLDMSLTGGKIACNGGTTTLTATVLIATPPYSYAWSNGFNQAASTSTVSNNTTAKVGSHTVTVTDGLGCTASQQYTLTEPPVLTVSTTRTNPTTVSGSDGKIGLIITGGIPAYATVLKLSGATIAPTQTTTPQYNGLSKGTYFYTVTDANGCISTDSVTLTDTGGSGCNLRDTMTFGKIACFGGTTTVTVTVRNGVAPYSYDWNNGFTQTASTSNISNNTTAKAGIHKVTVTSGGCTIVDSVILTEPPLLIVTPTSTNITTLGGADGKIGLTITGGTPAYATVLKLAGATIAPTQTTTPQYNGLSKGLYSYIVTDANSCTQTGTIALNEPLCLSGIEKANAGIDILECAKTTSLLKANAIQNTIQVTGKWSVLRGGSTISSPTTAQTPVSNLSQGSNLFVWTLTDSLCGFMSKDTVEVISEPKPQLENTSYTLDANSRQMLINIQDILAKKMTNPTAVQIFPNQILPGLGKVIVQNSQSILYTVENYVGNSTIEVPLKVCSQVCPNLCDSAKLSIHVNIIDNGRDLIIPKVFPVDHGSALLFLELGNLEWYPVNEMTIVDRWGNLVFGPTVYKNKTVEHAWDGTKRGQRLPTGAYYFYITYLDYKLLRIKRGVIYLIDQGE